MLLEADPVEQLALATALIERPSTFPCASTGSDDLQVWEQFKMLNTMPTRARSWQIGLGIIDLDAVENDLAALNGSSALTHLIRVDFPEPDGPQTTTTSPLATEVVQSFSAWKLAVYHLLTWLISIMRELTSTDNGNARLQAADGEGRDTGNHEIDGGGKQIHFD